MFLVDTNVFLEILLAQDGKEKCKAFLKDHSDSIHISDLSLHSIGIVLFREKQAAVFHRFILIVTLDADFRRVESTGAMLFL